jgi:uncharacterized protein (UPF0335 family)
MLFEEDKKDAENTRAKTGDNSAKFDDPAASDMLKSIVERITRLEEEKKTIGDDIKEIYAEAKGNGYDTKILRKAVARSLRDRNEVREEDAILELYEQALGVFA